MTGERWKDQELNEHSCHAVDGEEESYAVGVEAEASRELEREAGFGAHVAR